MALLERSLATVAAHVELAGAYVEQGMLVRSELLRAEVERSRIDDLLAEARGQARLAESGLSLRLAAADDSGWQIEPLPEPGAAGRAARRLARRRERPARPRRRPGGC